MQTYVSVLLPDSFLEKYKNKVPNWGFNGLGYIVYKRTYARRIEGSDHTEEWWQTVARCINGAQDIGADYTAEEAQRLYDLVFNLKCNFAGRMLWQLGTDTVKRFGANSLLNCFGGETEFITAQGIKQLKDCVGQDIEVLAAKGGWKKATVKEFGKQQLLKLTIKRGRTEKDIFTTANHRWFARSETRKTTDLYSGFNELVTTDLRPGMHLKYMFGQGIKNLLPSSYGVGHGITYGDGNYNSVTKYCQVTLCGKKNEKLKKWFAPSPVYDVPSACKEGALVLSHLPGNWKEAPSFNESKAYLLGFLMGYFAADGGISKRNGFPTLYSKRWEDILLVRDICSLLGIGTKNIKSQLIESEFNTNNTPLYNIGLEPTDLTADFFIITEHKEKYLLHYTETGQDLNLLNSQQGSRTHWEVVSVEKTNREEIVYCVVEPETHTFTLADNILTGNCWYCSINDPKTFLFIFENLMLGGGVGFSIRREDIHELPKIKKNVSVEHICTKDADFIVPDSRSGWVELLRKVLDAYYVTGKSFSYSTILVRGAGERISGFGGTASGPGILIEGIEKISNILRTREGKKLRSTDVLDICNIIGSIVVAGNVRRSAQIALGDPDDYLYLRAKNWSLGNIPNWRAMSNNTIYADDFSHISNEIWTNGYVVDKETGFAKGEPYGFFNLPLSQKYGRLKDGAMKNSKLYPTNEDNVLGTNPCAEISLTSYECCNLSELYLNNIESVEELIDCATLLYKTQKATAAMPFIHDETNKIVHKNMRLGLGVTGICQCSDEKIKWLDKGYEALRKFDKEWSKKKGYAESIKLTTVKPSGTLSLLAGSTPGVHPAYSPFYIRRVRMGSDDKLASICRDLGYHVEFVRGFDGKDDHSTVVVSFPCFSGDECMVAKCMTAVQQLDLVKKLQTYWSDNAVSVTVYYRQEELEEIKAWLEQNYETSIKSVSFLLHNEHGFAQAPYEEITEQEYQKLIEKVKPIATINIGQGDIESMECESGACPIK